MSAAWTTSHAPTIYRPVSRNIWRRRNSVTRLITGVYVKSICRLVAFKSHLFVCAVAEWFVRGCPAATKRNTVTVPGIATAAIPYCQVAIKHQRTIFNWLDREFAAIVRFGRTCLTDGAVIGKAFLLM